MQRIYSGIFLAALLAIAGSASAENEEAARELLSQVTLQDGISQTEAEKIATAYFLYNVGCGAFSGITNAEKNWVVQGGFGYAGTPIVGFFIDKQTGAITSPIGPSYNSPLELLSTLNGGTRQ